MGDAAGREDLEDGPRPCFASSLQYGGSGDAVQAMSYAVGLSAYQSDIHLTASRSNCKASPNAPPAGRFHRSLQELVPGVSVHLKPSNRGIVRRRRGQLSRVEASPQSRKYHTARAGQARRRQFSQNGNPASDSGPRARRTSCGSAHFVSLRSRRPRDLVTARRTAWRSRPLARSFASRLLRWDWRAPHRPIFLCQRCTGQGLCCPRPGAVAVVAVPESQAYRRWVFCSRSGLCSFLPFGTLLCLLAPQRRTTRGSRVGRPAPAS